MRRTTILTWIIAALGNCFCAVAAEGKQYDYLLLTVDKPSALQEELDQVAAQGFRFGIVNSTGIIMQRERGREVQDIFQYKVLEAKKRSTMQKEMSQFGAEGFRFRGSHVRRKKIVILERNPQQQPDQYEYIVLGTIRISTMRKELGEAGDAGFDLLEMDGQHDGSGLTSILQRRVDHAAKATGEREQYDYLLFETGEKLELEHGDSKEPVKSLTIYRDQTKGFKPKVDLSEQTNAKDEPDISDVEVVSKTKYSSMEEKLNRATTQGFRLATMTERRTTTAGSFLATFAKNLGSNRHFYDPKALDSTVYKIVVAMKRKRGREEEIRFRYDVLTSPHSVRPISDTAFYGRESVILEEDLDQQPYWYETRMSSSKKAISVQLNLDEASDEGFELMETSGIRSPVVVLRRKQERRSGKTEKAAGDGSGVYRYGSGITSPVLIAQTTPSYTDAAIKAKVQGKVWLQAIIRKDGRADNFKVVQGLGHGLDEQAIQEIKANWRFQPGRLNGEPVDTLVTLWIQFDL